MCQGVVPMSGYVTKEAARSSDEMNDPSVVITLCTRLSQCYRYDHAIGFQQYASGTSCGSFRLLMSVANRVHRREGNSVNTFTQLFRWRNFLQNHSRRHDSIRHNHNKVSFSVRWLFMHVLHSFRHNISRSLVENRDRNRIMCYCRVNFTMIEIRIRTDEQDSFIQSISQLWL